MNRGGENPHAVALFSGLSCPLFPPPSGCWPPAKATEFRNKLPQRKNILNLPALRGFLLPFLVIIGQ